MQPIELTFSSSGITLAATLTADPTGDPAPAALIISGSGPLDRNSNTKKLRIGVAGHVADALASAGIAGLRYDKRGVGSSGGDFRSTGFFDNVADARAALDVLRGRPEIDPTRVFLVGHSEGALIATEVAADAPDLAGTVLLAGSARCGEEVLRWQAAEVSKSLPRPVELLLKILRQDVLATQAKRLEQIKASDGDTMRVGFARMNARWFREFMAHDPSDSLSRIRVPVLAVTGSKDIQVDPHDTERICGLVGDACTSRIISDMTHLLRHEPGEPSLRTYKRQARQPLEPVLLSLLTSWMLDRAAHATR